MVKKAQGETIDETIEKVLRVTSRAGMKARLKDEMGRRRKRPALNHTSVRELMSKRVPPSTKQETEQ